MPEAALPFAEAMASLPPQWPDDGLRAEIRRRLEATATTVVVVDDDPTGTQTVHDVPILTTWGEAELAAEIRTGEPAFYVLSNSRSLAPRPAQDLARTLGANLAAARSAGRAVAPISRSDSTLRGHYPAETDALADGLGMRPDGVIIAPYFREGGRYTIGDVHYVLEGERLVPAADTESARDHAFGYRHSNLRRWVEEKSRGRWRASDVASLPLDLIRGGGPDAVAGVLATVHGGRPVVVNAACDRDLEVVVMGLLAAEEAGKRFLCRTAASFAKVRAGIADRGLLAASELLGEAPDAGGGLIVVGSYVPRSTRQLQALLASGHWQQIELPVPRLLDAALAEAALAEARQQLARHLTAGHDVVLFTSRRLETGATAEESLAVGCAVSRALVSLVAGLERAPRFLIAKGGITSSDVATAGLGVRRALVLGQIAPGVPVWRLGPESRFPGLPYVVFPGNVGSDATLAEVATSLSAQAGPG
ncbi:MAG: four-carbon acid sugar kinase family protein [Anaerolineae bacterium]